MDLSEINKIINKTDSGRCKNDGGRCRSGAEAVQTEMPRKRVDKSRSSVSMRLKGREHTLSGSPTIVYTKYTKNTKNTKYTLMSSTPMSSSRKDQKQEQKEKNHIEETVNVIETESVSEPIKTPKKKISDHIEKATIQMRHDKKRKSKRKVDVQLTIKGEYYNFRCNLTPNMSHFRKFDDDIVSINEQLRVINLVQDIHTSIMNSGVIQKGHKIYMGKIRPKAKYVKGVPQNQKLIPNTYLVVYYNIILRAWCFIIQFKDWEHNGELSPAGLTQNQIDTDITCQHIHYKQEYVTYKTDADRLEDMGY